MLNKLFAFILSVISFFFPLVEIESSDVLSLSDETVAQSAVQYGVVGIESVEVAVTEQFRFFEQPVGL